MSREGRRARIGCGALFHIVFIQFYAFLMSVIAFYFVTKGNWSMVIIAVLCATVPFIIAAKLGQNTLLIIPYFICGFGGYFSITKGNWRVAIILLFVAVSFYLVTKLGQNVLNRQQTTTLPQTPETTPEQAAPEQEEAPHPLNISAESVAPADVPDLIRRLGELRDAGEITNEEYERKKAELLGRM